MVFYGYGDVTQGLLHCEKRGVIDAHVAEEMQ
jgi:hypothetical protein